MGFHREQDLSFQQIGRGRRRAQVQTGHMMMVIFDFEDGPAAEPDPPHSHPHEQISYVAAGEVVYILGRERRRLGPGDMVTIPPDLPHAIQTLTARVRLVDAFHPPRRDFSA